MPRAQGTRPSFFALRGTSFVATRASLGESVASPESADPDATKAGAGASAGFFRRAFKATREQFVFFVREMRSHLLH